MLLTAFRSILNGVINNKMIRFYLLLICIFTFCGCEKSSSEKTLKLTFLSEVNSLDPRFGYEIPANHAVKMLFEGLMRFSPDRGLIPAAAESYQISQNQKKYTFKIRPSKWINGQPVTAFDFEYAWKSIVDPKLPTQGAADFYPIKNVEAIVRGDLPVDAAGITAIDAETLVVELAYPCPFFLELTATSAYSPIYRNEAEKNPFSEHFQITNGPFYLKEWVQQDHMIFEKNPAYWNAGSVSLERIEISIIEDVSTQLALFEKGESDWFGKPFAKLPLDAVPDLESKMLLHHFPEKAVYWYFINTEKYPFNHPKVRRAFGLAVDRHEIVSHLLKEKEECATSVNRGYHLFNDGAIDEAKALFCEALEEMGIDLDSFPVVHLSYCNIETNHRIACAVQQQWQNVFKIQVKLDPQEWTTYYDNLSNGKFEIGGLSWHSRVRDPIYNLQLFKYSDDRLNMANWENQEFQKLIDGAQGESNLQKRQTLLEKAESILMDEMPIIPLYFLTISYAKNSLLDHVYLSDMNEIDFAWAVKN